jgi:hypothetical protein
MFFKGSAGGLAEPLAAGQVLAMAQPEHLLGCLLFCALLCIDQPVKPRSKRPAAMIKIILIHFHSMRMIINEIIIAQYPPFAAALLRKYVTK